MSLESDIVSAVNSLGLFSKARYLVMESTQDNDPTPLPFFVLGGAQTDDQSFRTFCGSALTVRSYEATIGADTTADLQDAVSQVKTALAGIVSVVAVTDDFDEQGGFYFSLLTLSEI